MASSPAIPSTPTMASPGLRAQLEAMKRAIEQLQAQVEALSSAGVTSAQDVNLPLGGKIMWGQGASTLQVGASSTAPVEQWRAGSGILNRYYDAPNHIFRSAAGSEWLRVTSTGVTFTAAPLISVNQNSNSQFSHVNASAGASAAAVSEWQTGTTNSYSVLGVHDNAGAPYEQWTAGGGIQYRYYSAPNHIFQSTGGTTMVSVTSTAVSNAGFYQASVAHGSGAQFDASSGAAIPVLVGGNRFLLGGGGYHLVLVAEVAATGATATYMLGNGTTILLGANSGYWTTGTPGATQCSIQYDAGTSSYRIYAGASVSGGAAYKVAILKAH